VKKIIDGKVRDVYEISESEVVIVTTDRVSAFDVILPSPVPNKGKALNKLSSFWFDYTGDIIENHMISEDLNDMPEYFRKDEFKDRTILVKNLKMLPFEFIIRGYMFGNMWNSYKETSSFCGCKLREGYELAERLETPILTPSSKSSEGHDIYITMEDVKKELGEELTEKIKDVSLKLYERCYNYAYEKGIIIADTKLEFGINAKGELVLADEIFTPDSSRFWDKNEYRTGVSPTSFDKQFLRDWLIANKLNGVIPAPQIPEDIMKKTAAKYLECQEKIVPAGK